MEFAVKWIPASDYLKGNSISVIWTSPFFPQGAPALLLCPIIDGRSMSFKHQHFSPENWEYNVNVLRIKALNRENRLEYESLIVWELYCVYQVIWWTKTPGVYFHPWGKRSICDVNSERTISPWCSTGYAREKPTNSKNSSPKLNETNYRDALPKWVNFLGLWHLRWKCYQTSLPPIHWCCTSRWQSGCQTWRNMSNYLLPRTWALYVIIMTLEFTWVNTIHI